MKKNLLKVSVLFIAPALLMSTITIIDASWKDSIIDGPHLVNKETYTIEFYKNDTPYGKPYEGLEYNSGFELPIIKEEGFSGWGVTEPSNIGPAYIGYYHLNEFSANINSERTLKLYAKYNIQ